MPFNLDKCQVFQGGTKNRKFDYEMRSVKLKSILCAKNLGVKVTSDITFSQQCTEEVNNMNRMLAFINMNL